MIQEQLAAVILASGRSTRFGENKLLHLIGGQPMIEKLFSALPKDLFSQIIVVSMYDPILELAARRGCLPVYNDDQTDDIAKTIALGIEAVDPAASGCMFFVSDQPWLKTQTILRLASRFDKEPQNIHVPLCGGRQGNPVVFPARFFEQLRSLPRGCGGKTLCRQYPDSVSFLSVDDPLELKDIDRKTDLPPIR